MESALRIPEILHAILECLASGPSLIVCSTVCKFWSDTATNIIWSKSVISTTHLFNLIPALRRLLLMCRINFVKSTLFYRFMPGGGPEYISMDAELRSMEEVGMGSTCKGQVVVKIVRERYILSYAPVNSLNL